MTSQSIEAAWPTFQWAGVLWAGVAAALLSAWLVVALAMFLTAHAVAAWRRYRGRVNRMTEPDNSLKNNRRQAVVPAENRMRKDAAAAAAVLFPGSHYARAGFNAGVAWTLTQIKSDHPDAWELLERDWKDRQP
jgi:HAMP domain-containing protein